MRGGFLIPFLMRHACNYLRWILGGELCRDDVRAVTDFDARIVGNLCNRNHLGEGNMSDYLLQIEALSDTATSVDLFRSAFGNDIDTIPLGEAAC